jgi:hypothetical protein
MDLVPCLAEIFHLPLGQRRKAQGERQGIDFGADWIF